METILPMEVELDFRSLYECYNLQVIKQLKCKITESTFEVASYEIWRQVATVNVSIWRKATCKRCET